VLDAVLVDTKTKKINRVASPIAKPDIRLIVTRQPALPVSLVNIKMKTNKPNANLVRLDDTKMKPNNASVVKHVVLVNIKTTKPNQVVTIIVRPDISSTLHEQHVYCVRLANIKTKKINRVASPIAPWAIILIQEFHAWFVP